MRKLAKKLTYVLLTLFTLQSVLFFASPLHAYVSNDHNELMSQEIQHNHVGHQHSEQNMDTLNNESDACVQDMHKHAGSASHACCHVSFDSSTNEIVIESDSPSAEIQREFEYRKIVSHNTSPPIRPPIA